MSAVVTDQFRISNAGNFVDSVTDTNNNYYVFLGLSNPAILGTDGSPSDTLVGFGRTDTWNTSPPNPIDNINHNWNNGSTALFGKKITSGDIRRVVRKVDWKTNTPYDMYRQDYSINNLAPVSKTARLYDANYFVVNSDYNVYICISNGSSGSSSQIPTSKNEPTFTDLEPTSAGAGDDDYIWKYLFTISPSDIVKFDSTEYIVVPNDWATSTNSSIQSVREAADSLVNFNQIKEVYIKNPGSGYIAGPHSCDIVGDGSGGKVSVTVDTGTGTISKVVVTAGGSGYTYGMVDLGNARTESYSGNFAELIVIIPPSRGHGYDIYRELGAERVLVYSRFDDSTKDFPIDTKFAQVGFIKNPSTYTSRDVLYTGSEYSSLYGIKFNPNNTSAWGTNTPVIGSKITQTRTDGKIAKGYVASYDKTTSVLKYYQDRSLYYNQTTGNQQDYVGISTEGGVHPFESADTSGNINFVGPTSPSPTPMDKTFTGRNITSGDQQIDLGVYFTNGLSEPQINKTTGDILYIDNREEITRNLRQKEDIKIILEF